MSTFEREGHKCWMFRRAACLLRALNASTSIVASVSGAANSLRAAETAASQPDRWPAHT